MTANDLIQKLQSEVSKISTGNIPLFFNDVEYEVDVEFKQDERGYYIELKPKIEGTPSKFPMIPQCKDSLHIEETCKENADSFTYDLEEAAEEYAYDLQLPEIPLHILVNTFKAGAEWMKEQMMALKQKKKKKQES